MTLYKCDFISEELCMGETEADFYSPPAARPREETWLVARVRRDAGPSRDHEPRRPGRGAS